MRLKVPWRAYKVPASGVGLSMMGEPPGEN